MDAIPKAPPERTVLLRFAVWQVALSGAVLALAWAMQGAPAGFLRAVSTAWDGEWYLAIVREGYPNAMDPDGAAYAFAPLFPILIALFGAFDLAPLLIDRAAAIGALVILHHLRGPRIAWGLALWPFWLTFTNMGLSIGPFALLAMCMFWALERNRPSLAGIAAAAAALTRYIGGVPIAAVAFLWFLRKGPIGFARFASPVAAAALGVLIWHRVAAGDWLFFFTAQNMGWESGMSWPWNHVASVWSVSPWLLVLDLAVIAAAAAGTLRLWRRHDRLAAFASGAVVILLLLTVGSSAKWAIRLSLAAFPAFAVLMAPIARSRWTFAASIVIAAATLHAMLLLYDCCV